MATFKLNTSKNNTYAFFCPQSRLHVTWSNPVGVTDRVTPAIIRAVKNKTLIDVDGVINGSQGETEKPEPAKQAEPVKQPAPEPQKEEKQEEKPKRGRKKAQPEEKATE